MLCKCLLFQQLLLVSSRGQCFSVLLGMYDHSHIVCAGHICLYALKPRNLLVYTFVYWLLEA